jgi:phosphoribosylanthranilate isomerase
MNVEVKICGVTSPEDAVLAAELGAGYLGLNFYPGSPRYVTTEHAREIADAVRGRSILVGVFVNRPAAEISAIADAVGLDLLQFHGDETPEEIAPFASRALKVFRGGDPGEAALASLPAVWGLLFDRAQGALYGGTGIDWDYRMVAKRTAQHRVFIAGGLGSDNVRRAIESSGAFGIDVCSRVESSPGRKDRELLTRLFDEVRHGQGRAS